MLNHRSITHPTLSATSEVAGGERLDNSALSQKYIPAVDGLRAVSITFVLLGHFGLGKIIPGGFGVTVFFFISGFLITRLLLTEIRGMGHIDLPNFYLRRFARLGPALIVFVVATSVVFWLVNHRIDNGAVASSLLYVMNYYRIFTEQYDIPTQSYMSTLGLLWSLAVEEHYYILFPVALGWLAKSGKTLPAFIALVVLALVWRIALRLTFDLPENYTYMATDCRFDSIMYGAILAVLFQSETSRKRWEPLLCSSAAVYASVVVLLLCFLIRDTFLRETFRYSAQGIALLPIVASLVFSSRAKGVAMARSVLSRKPVVFLGKLSYSLYLWHYSGIVTAAYLLPQASGFARLVVAVSIAVVLSLLSYFVVERSFLSLRHRLGSGAR